MSSVDEGVPVKRKSRAGEYLLMAAIVIVAIGAIAGYGFYHEEIGGFMRLEGWNLQPVKEASREFVKAAAAGDGDQVAKMLATENGASMTAVRRNGKLVAMKVPAYGGPVEKSLKELAPTDSPQIGAPKLVLVDNGQVFVSVSYPKSNLGIGWDRVGGAWKVTSLTWAGSPSSSR